MGQLMGAKQQTFQSELTHDGEASGRGQIIVRTQAIQSSYEIIKWRLNWRGIKNKVGGCLGMCPERIDWQCRIQKEVPGTDKFVTVVTLPGSFSESDWHMQMHKMTLTELCNSQKGSQIKFQVVGPEPDHIVFNSVTTTVQQIMDAEFSFLADAGKNCQLEITDFECYVRPTLADYLIFNGWHISLVVAIDYTESNGPPELPRSLHFMGPNNQYESALINVGNVVEPYTLDRCFPVFGFGGWPKHIPKNPQSGISFCFNVNGTLHDPHVIGIQAVVDTYRSTLPSIKLAGPTFCAPLLRNFRNYVMVQQEYFQYQILLLLTDGEVTDMPETKEIIVELSEMPCSIIIVGVGNEKNFASMRELDGQDGPLTAGDKVAARDIVQFIAYTKAMKNGNLAEQVLKDIPEQFVTYMELTDIRPQYIQQIFF